MDAAANRLKQPPLSHWTARLPRAAGAGKTFTLEGSRAKDSGRSSSEGDGVVHFAIDELFKLLNQKAASVGERLLCWGWRMSSSRRGMVSGWRWCETEVCGIWHGVNSILVWWQQDRWRLVVVVWGAGDMIAQKRRMPAAKAFDFFLESSYVELYNEGCHDLYQRGAAVQASLPVYEDEMEGHQVGRRETR
jgi:hypothetical protein